MQIDHQEHGQAIFTLILAVAFTKARVVACIKALAEDSMRVQVVACTKAQREGFTKAPTEVFIRDRVVGYTMGRRITAVIDLHCRYLFKSLTAWVILMKQN